MSTANTLAEALLARLSVICKADGYASDIGRSCHRGKSNANAPCLTLFEDEEAVLDQTNGACLVRAPFVVEAADRCAVDQTNAHGHALIADIQRALWHDEARSMGGIPLSVPLAYAGRRILDREDGADIVVVQVRFNATFVIHLGAVA